MELELEKPRRDLDKYIEGRFKEALYEAELALKFLEAGMYRNAAGKAFQAFKALLAAPAARHRGTLAARHPGVKTTKGGRRVLYVDWLIATMPTGQMLEVARDLAAAEGGLIHYANTALNLHEFQHNALDKSGVLSRYTRHASVEDDVRALASYVAERAKSQDS
ncbi:MAG: PaREP1 family protein [Pyrobaculum sp.]